jgi:DNA-binding NarL/FixJ family response regulator
MTRKDREQRNQRIRERLVEGATCKQIAEELRVSLSVVSKSALSAGYRSHSGRTPKYDWNAIRAYYEGGRTLAECRERFGFSKGAWNQAVARGDVVPRARPDPIKHSHETRQAVARLLDEGMTQAEIARTLAISRGTVAFHVRSLGVPADKRFARRYDWAAVQRAYDTGLTAGACREHFGCSAASWSQAVKRGDLLVRPRREPLAAILAVGRRRSRYHVKQRLLEAGLKNARCERCGLIEWRGEPVSLELHHVSGDPLDNRLESLQLLCPNCHSQTENYGIRNARQSGTSSEAA